VIDCSFRKSYSLQAPRLTAALTALVAFGPGIIGGPSAKAQSLSVLHSFTGQDGQLPSSTLIMDKAGNLYGTTLGTVFKLDASGKETVLHSFTGADGAHSTAGLIMDAAGNLYGTTYAGGSLACSADPGFAGCGTVFKLDTSARRRSCVAAHVRYRDNYGQVTDPRMPLRRLLNAGDSQ
jgi:uncharacterized repeat protein (TIGR03803 family)